MTRYLPLHKFSRDLTSRVRSDSSGLWSEWSRGIMREHKHHVWSRLPTSERLRRDPRAYFFDGVGAVSYPEAFMFEYLGGIFS
jgi:hypothetical protein